MAENQKPGSVTEIAHAVGEIVDKVPFYQDAIQPAAKELGKGLQVVARTVNACLIPIEGLVWGVEQIREFVRDRVAKKLVHVPVEDIQQPKPHIAVPAIDALRYTGADGELSELYANLLATSMDKVTAYHAHPGFVDMIKNMCPDEAKIMRWLAGNPYSPLVNVQSVSKKDRSYKTIVRHASLIGVDANCEHPPLAPIYLDNLERLGLVQIEETVMMTNEKFYERIEEHPDVKRIVDELNATEGRKAGIDRIRLKVTDLGTQFVRACVLEKSSARR